MTVLLKKKEKESMRDKCINKHSRLTENQPAFVYLFH